MMRVMLAPFLWLFWWISAVTVKPGHQSYIYARWRMWQETYILKQYKQTGRFP